MATIPNGTRFIGIAETVNLVERKTATQNAQTEPYTIEEQLLEVFNEYKNKKTK